MLPNTVSRITFFKRLAVLPQVLPTILYGYSPFSVTYVALTVMVIWKPFWYNLLS